MTIVTWIGDDRALGLPATYAASLLVHPSQGGLHKPPPPPTFEIFHFESHTVRSDCENRRRGFKSQGSFLGHIVSPSFQLRYRGKTYRYRFPVTFSIGPDQSAGSTSRPVASSMSGACTRCTRTKKDDVWASFGMLGGSRIGGLTYRKCAQDSR